MENQIPLSVLKPCESNIVNAKIGTHNQYGKLINIYKAWETKLINANNGIHMSIHLFKVSYLSKQIF